MGASCVSRRRTIPRPAFSPRSEDVRSGSRSTREGRIVTCVAGMGLVRVTLKGDVELLTDQTERSFFSIQDDTTIRMADDLDIAADGTIYFTDATKRYDIADWGLDLLEGRPNGRLLSFEPKSRTTRTVCDNLIFPNGVCLTHDGRHLLVASTWTCSILIFDLRKSGGRARGFSSADCPAIQTTSTALPTAVIGSRSPACAIR